MVPVCVNCGAPSESCERCTFCGTAFWVPVREVVEVTCVGDPEPGFMTVEGARWRETNVRYVERVE